MYIVEPGVQAARMSHRADALLHAPINDGNF
jgi:hypothetical protein